MNLYCLLQSPRFGPAVLIKKFIARFKKYWKEISGPGGKSPGRPVIAEEIKTLIKQMLRQNINIGGLRIYMNLRQLGINDISLSSVYRIIRELKKEIEHERSQKWKTFLYNSRVVAMDFLTVPVEVTKDVFRLLYIFIVIDHERRIVLHHNCTFEPNEEWVIQQLKNCFGNDHHYKYMIHDRDTVFMNRVKLALPEYFGIQSNPTAPRSPWQNAFVESLNGTLRRELLNHVIVKDEFHLRRLLREYIDFYNTRRMHSGLMEAPCGNTVKTRPPGAKLKSKPVLNGLHHVYYWSGHEPGDLLKAA